MLTPANSKLANHTQRSSHGACVYDPVVESHPSVTGPPTNQSSAHCHAIRPIALSHDTRWHMSIFRILCYVGYSFLIRFGWWLNFYQELGNRLVADWEQSKHLPVEATVVGGPVPPSAHSSAHMI